MTKLTKPSDQSSIMAFTPWIRFFVCAFASLWFASLPSNASSQSTSDAVAAKPTKEELIRTLKLAMTLLEKNELEAASVHFVVPEDFKPEMLSRLVEIQEISMAGIEILEKNATFGTAAETFGEERAQALAERAGVDVAQAYGFYYEREPVTAEVLAVWNSSAFKIFRLDDVGKLKMDKSTEPSSSTPLKNMSTRDILKQLPEYREAVEANPEDIQARLTYSRALFLTDNLPLAWEQLGIAQKIDPQNSDMQAGMESVLREFKYDGLFTVGTPAETIRSVLGEPQEVVPMQQGARWVYAFMGVDFRNERIHEIIDLRGATNALFQPTEIIDVALDGRGWTCGLRDKFRSSSQAFYFLPGERISEWTEMIFIERTLDGAKAGSIDEIAKTIATKLASLNPNCRWKILTQDATSAIVALEDAAPPDEPQIQQLIRIFRGPVDIHTLSYSLKSETPPDIETQKKWLAIFQSATLK